MSTPFKMKGWSPFTNLPVSLVKKVRKIGYKANKGTTGEGFYGPEEIREYDPGRVDPKTGKVLA